MYIHMYILCMYIVVCLVTKSCPTLFETPWLQPTRLLCPWDFPGKNTGVGCHSFSRGSSRPRDQTHVSCLGKQTLYQPPGKPLYVYTHTYKYALRILLIKTMTCSLRFSGSISHLYLHLVLLLFFDSLPNSFSPAQGLSWKTWWLFQEFREGTLLVVQGLRLHTLNAGDLGWLPGSGN